MVFAVSEGSVRALSRPVPLLSTNIQLAPGVSEEYAALWRKQPSIRTVVTFLARNVSDLGLHVYRRVSDTERERVTDHPLASVLSKPNPRTTRYRLLNGIVHDLGIYDAAYLLKVKNLGLIRIPPSMVTPVGDNWFWPDAFEVRGSKGKQTIAADRFVHFRGYSAIGDVGTSPLESLRQILIEEYAASKMREQTMKNGARVSGYLERPPGVKEWSQPARDRFARSWRQQYTGDGPQTGGTPILEDGMKFVPAAQTAEQLQYIEGRKLTREEAAAAYFIPPPMVGLLDNATFSNITEQHKMLYQDTLGPLLTMIQEDLELQLVPEYTDTDGLYIEFNLQEKLKGSFEEQATSLQTSTGRPWMTANEARARQNLPPLEDGDGLVIPLNVLIGGQASPTDQVPEEEPPTELAAPRQLLGRKDAPRVQIKSEAPETHRAKAEEVLQAFFARQAKTVLSAMGAKAGPSWWDEKRWNRELGEDLLALGLLTSRKAAEDALDAVGVDPDLYDETVTLSFLTAVAASRAKMINRTTREQLEKAVADEESTMTPASVFEDAQSRRSKSAAGAIAATFASFGTVEAVKQVAGEEKPTKTWNVNSGKPRPSHSAMDGETVPIDEVFSNGMNWPGDPVGGPGEVAGCQCGVTVSIP